MRDRITCVFVSKARNTQKKKQQQNNIENENLLIFEVIKPAVNAASLVVDVFPHPSGPINNMCPLFCVCVYQKCQRNRKLYKIVRLFSFVKIISLLLCCI